jgi:hypothetical protein
MPGTKTPRFKKAQVAEALRKASGIKSLAAKMLGCSPATIRNYCARHPELEDVIAEAVEDTLDLAEAKVKQAIGKGDLRAAFFFLECKGKHRGYSRRGEVVIEGSLAVRPDPVRNLSDEQVKALADQYLAEQAAARVPATPRRQIVDTKAEG